MGLKETLRVGGIEDVGFGVPGFRVEFPGRYDSIKFGCRNSLSYDFSLHVELHAWGMFRLAWEPYASKNTNTP